jgi:RNA polymerase sigma factor (sigma-70 family)
MSDLGPLAEKVAGHAAALTLYASQWLDRADAEDAVQNALVSLLGLRKAPDEPMAWMYRAVRNAAIDLARSSKRRRNREETVAQNSRPWFTASPDRAIDAQQTEAALKNLPRQMAEIIILRIWADLAFSQIAAILSVSVSSAHDRYTAALRQLKAEMEKLCPATK